MTLDPDVPAGEERKQEKDEGTAKQAGTPVPEEQLYDLVIPPGTPQTIIMDIVGNYEVKLVERKERLHFANMDGDERELLAFRGKLEVMQNVEKYFYQKMREFIGDT
ncbi:MAG TPA: hypothetical protein VMS89_03035 [Methanoregulaceae archaeon]|nr:hypothetical protein [Methanoregulaceae archaeon]